MTQKYTYPKIFVLGNWEFTATPTTPSTTPPTPPQETYGLPQITTPITTPKALSHPHFQFPSKNFKIFSFLKFPPRQLSPGRGKSRDFKEVW